MTNPNDVSGVETALTLFPEQIKTTFEQGFSADIPKLNPNGVLVSGMGGSSNAAKIIQGLFEKKLKIPFEVFNDYGLPSWVNENSLLVANSYSGNTEETLSAVTEAKKVNAKILGVATGGKIGEMINNKEIYGVVIDPKDTNPTGFPKTGLGVSLGGLMGALSKARIIDVTEAELNSALAELTEIRKIWNVDEMAKNLYSNMPVLFGARPLLGALNAGRNAFCEISRNYIQFYDFPEVNHVLVEAMGKPQGALNNYYLFFESNFYNDRIKLRFEITKDLLKKQNLRFVSYQLKGKTELTQSLELAHFCAWMAFNFSVLDNVDPGPEPWIIELKTRLAQPVH